jgi:pyruvate-formate lyase-activating enzyme
MKKIRLLLWEKCNRSCDGCCNKGFDLVNLTNATIDDIRDCDEIYLTGGEPMLYPDVVLSYIRFIREASPKTKICVYTADVSNIEMSKVILEETDGMTVTLHKTEDIFSFVEFALTVMDITKNRSCRLNVFKNVNFDLVPKFLGWKVKQNIEWIPDCPLPKDEVFLKAKAINVLYDELHPNRNKRLAFHDEKPDELGRRHFTLYWERYDPTNMFKQEISPDGYVQRGQGFFTDPTRFIEEGYKVI